MNKLKDAITGVLVGDALGLPFQFLDRDTFTCTDMVGYGTFRMPAGSFSDDGSLTLATLDSLRTYGGVNTEDIMHRFSTWLTDGEYTQYGQAYDIGGGTMQAIERYLDGFPVAECGGRNERNNGNGSLMRIMPVAFWPHTDADIEAVSAVTHAHEIARTACRIYIAIADALLAGVDKFTAVQQVTEAYEGHPQFGRLSTIHTLERDDIRSSGYVVDSLEAALWSFLRTDNYRDCLLLAVNLGEDTDSIGAVAGGLCGIVYGIGGEKGIPQAWADLVTRESWVQDLLTD